MDDQSKNNSINKDSNGDKTKIVKTQKRENTNDKMGNINNEGSAPNNNETNTKVSHNQTPSHQRVIPTLTSRTTLTKSVLILYSERQSKTVMKSSL
ncbi:hypothetical protein ACOMICROBIO_LKFPLAJE_03615 [Vibrio sp. B1FIG11]|nr:hypothetical protein ACOMICROBIO_LKFPLAJE_03615 [Vibrio sp. B1FIG11]